MRAEQGGRKDYGKWRDDLVCCRGADCAGELRTLFTHGFHRSDALKCFCCGHRLPNEFRTGKTVVFESTFGYCMRRCWTFICMLLFVYIVVLTNGHYHRRPSFSYPLLTLNTDAVRLSAARGARSRTGPYTRHLDRNASGLCIWRVLLAGRLLAQIEVAAFVG